MLPTPYPEVNALLRELADGVRPILGDHVVGIYLFGSLANGGFDEDSDIDVVVVTDDEISDALFSALQAMHARIALGESRWATQLEVSYMPRHPLRRFDLAHARHPHIDRDKGERLHWMVHDRDWVVQRYILRERGVVVDGPAPKTLIDPVSPDDLRQAMLPVLRLWGTPLLGDRSQLSSRGYQSFIVLSVCRILYTLQHGTVVSKPAAARWAQATLEERWAPLIERALEGRHNPEAEAPLQDVNGTLDFLRYALERSV